MRAILTESLLSCLVRAALLLALIAAFGAAPARELRVCADPNNLPFSNVREEGFENRIVQLVAKELNADVRYVWWAQRRGNIRSTLDENVCDVIPGIGSDIKRLATTRPYYRSSYVFVTRADDELSFSGFDDARLQSLRIGVQMIGDDFANTPPAHALARRGRVDNVRGYMVYGDYAQENPSRAIIDDVANGRLGTAIVWGPLAGYFASSVRQPVSLKLQPVIDPEEPLLLPMSFDISMGVRKRDRALLAELDAALAKSRRKIKRVLEEFGVPLTTLEP